MTVDYRFGTAGASLALVLAVLVVAGYLTRAVVTGDRPLRQRVVAALQRATSGAVSALVAAAVGVERLRAIVVKTLDRLRQQATVAIGTAIAAIRTQDFEALPRPRAFRSKLQTAFATLVARVRTVAPDTLLGPEDSGEATADTDASPDPETAKARIEQAWREFRAQVPVDDHRVKTPGELARRAIEAGFPESAVRTLRDAIRDVEYGRRDPATHVEDVVAAEREIEAATRPDSAEEAATDGGERT